MFISRGKEDALVTKNMVVGESVYGEKRISVEVRSCLLYFNLGENWSCVVFWAEKKPGTLMCLEGPGCSVHLQFNTMLHPSKVGSKQGE